MSTDSDFFDGYVECALWVGVDVEGRDESVSNPGNEISTELLHEAAKECADFTAANEADLLAYGERFGWEYAGHDFFLTRNRHGAGFWDRIGSTADPLYDACERLSEAARVYGESSWYVGDDGKIYA